MFRIVEDWNNEIKLVEASHIKLQQNLLEGL